MENTWFDDVSEKTAAASRRMKPSIAMKDFAQPPPSPFERVSVDRFNVEVEA